MPRSKFTLPRLSPHAPSGLEDFAARLDSVFMDIESIMQDFRAQEAVKSDDTDAVDGTPSQEVVLNRFALFIQAFQNDVEDYWNVVAGDTDGITYPSNGQTGGRALRNTGRLFLEFPQDIPYDADRLYRARSRVRVVSKSGATDVVHVGVRCYDAAGALLDSVRVAGNRDLASDTVGEWVGLKGYFTGVDDPHDTDSGTIVSPSNLPEGTVAIRPYFILDQDDNDSTLEIDFLAIDVLTESIEIDLGLAFGEITETHIADNSITTPKIAANQIIGGHIAADQITGNHIQAGEIDADHIQVDSLEAVSASIAGTISATNLVLSGEVQLKDGDRTIDISGSTIDTFGADARFSGQATIGGSSPATRINHQHVTVYSEDGTTIKSHARLSSGALRLFLESASVLCSTDIFASTDGLTLRINTDSTDRQFILSHASHTGEPMIAGIVISDSDPSGDYPDGTLWVKV